MLRSFSCVFLFGSIISTTAMGQTRCPIGVQAGNVQCIPDDPQAEVNAAPRPTGEWIKTWGAIASSDSGDIGSSTGKFSKKDAEAEAIKICADFGNSDCKVNMTYKNQCVAVVQAAKGRTGGKIITAETADIAKRTALQECQEDSGAQCFVRGTDCTEPYFRKY
ncbi:DUF4189 domain-containing protein [Pseudomonas quasicaspiana]|uniref:DUF4189 domain-containing protein n=1 Tax=Pseudomonas quasicaspiana TaxID=2829821 RepID=UPI001E5D9281|nr:DUF4189 domain-containing protein [Pseudomonas quasicaspiana]MCD5970621.1 DUF4189 domain-containing protein [Pseudomonas quasicaspiana]